MDSYFSVELCRGPFSGLTSEKIAATTHDVMSKVGPDDLGKFWEEFPFAESLLEQAADEVGEDIVATQNHLWVEACRKYIGEYLLQSAVELYLEDRGDATQRIIDGKSWIISGGITYDGDTTVAADHIRLVRFFGLDEALAPGV